MSFLEIPCFYITNQKTYNKTTLHYQLSHPRIEEVESEKYLGVYIHNNQAGTPT